MIGARVRPPGWVAAAAALLLAAAGCGAVGAEEDGTTGRVQVTATTPVVADLVRNVGGEHVEVRQLLPPGADPHEHELRPSDAAAVAGSAAVFRSGGDLDAWVDDLTVAGAAPDHALLGALPPEARGETHWWHDPRNAIVATEAIGAALARVDPSGAQVYRRNAAAYVRSLERLDREIARCFEGVPARDRELVPTHDSFDAFARRYDVRVLASVVPGRSTHAQPSIGETVALAERLRDDRVRAVFPEPGSDTGLERALANEAGAELGTPLWSDSLGPAGSSGATYLDAMSSNVEAMVEGFTGGARSCPELG